MEAQLVFSFEGNPGEREGGDIKHSIHVPSREKDMPAIRPFGEIKGRVYNPLVRFIPPHWSRQHEEIRQGDYKSMSQVKIKINLESIGARFKRVNLASLFVWCHSIGVFSYPHSGQ